MSFVSPMDHPNLTVVHFHSYAGGKFWINCLAHHSAFMPLLGKIHDRHWALFNIDDDLKQRLKLELINKTLPPADKLYNWCEYELGDIYMWGESVVKVTRDNVSKNALSLLEQYKCFTINHCESKFNLVKSMLPSAKHIILHNAQEFRKKASVLKGADAEVPAYPSWTLDADAFIVDVDNTWFDTNITIHHINRCLAWLGVEPELMPTLQNYIDNYFNLHK